MIRLSPFSPTPFCAPAIEVNGLYFVKAPGDPFISIYARYKNDCRWVPLHIGLPAIQTLQQVRDADRNILMNSGSYEDAHFYLRSADGNNMTAAYFTNASGGGIQVGNVSGYAPLNLQPLGGTLLYNGVEVATKSWVQNSGLFAPISHVGAGGNAHALATQSVAGFMGAADKTKLDGLVQGVIVETDPTVPAHVKAITTTNISSWNAKENSANKSTATALGTSNTLFPTQNAVKTYVDTAITNNNTNYVPVSQKGTANGVATLGADGKIPNGQIPAIALSETFVVNSQAAMLALSGAAIGDIAVRTDISKSFILTNNTPGTLASWQELLSPTVANTDQVPEGNTNLYFTTGRARSSVSAGNGISYDSATGIISNSAPNTPSNLAVGTRTSTTVPITNSDGTGVTLPVATTSLAGNMSAADKTKLDGLANYTLPTATSTVLGGVKVGSGLAINSTTGVLSATNTTTGTVTNVTGTAPVTVTNGTTTPVISMPQANASTNGWVSANDWNTFNAKVNTAGDTMTGSLAFNVTAYDPDGSAGSGNTIPAGIQYWVGDGLTNVPNSTVTILTAKASLSRTMQIATTTTGMWFRALHNTVATTWTRLLSEGVSDFYMAGNAARLRATTTGNFIISGNNGVAGGAIYLRPNGDTSTVNQFVLTSSGVTLQGLSGSGTRMVTTDASGNLGASSLPTINDGTLTLGTSGIATGSGSFTANQAGASAFTVNVPGTNVGGSPAEWGQVTSSTGTNSYIYGIRSFGNGASDGNTVSPTQYGMTMFGYSSSSTNMPTSGAGSMLQYQAATTGSALGGFKIAKSLTDDNEIYYRTGATASTWNSWQRFASKEWATATFLSATPTLDQVLTAGNISSNWAHFRLRQLNWYQDADGNNRLYFGDGSNTNGIILQTRSATENIQFRNSNSAIRLNLDFNATTAIATLGGGAEYPAQELFRATTAAIGVGALRMFGFNSSNIKTLRAYVEAVQQVTGGANTELRLAHTVNDALDAGVVLTSSTAASMLGRGVFTLNTHGYTTDHTVARWQNGLPNLVAANAYASYPGGDIFGFGGSGNNKAILAKNLGVFYNSVAVLGALVFKYPVANMTTGMIMQFKFSGHTYQSTTTTASTAFNIQITAYWQSGTWSVANRTCRVDGNTVAFNNDLIRLGVDASGNPCILFGSETTSLTAHTRIDLDEVKVHFSGAHPYNGTIGWYNTIETDLSGYTMLATLDVVKPYYMVNGQQEYVKNTSVSTSWNSALSSAKAMFALSSTDGPGGVAVYHGINIPHGSSSAYGSQIVFRNGAAYFRSIEANVIGAWKQIADRDWVNANVTLQSATNAGATTTNNITVTGTGGVYSVISGNNYRTHAPTTGGLANGYSLYDNAGTTKLAEWGFFSGTSSGVSSLTYGYFGIGSGTSLQSGAPLKVNGTGIGVNLSGSTAPSYALDINGAAKVSDLSGTGTRMVVADSAGLLSTQAIPTATGTVTSVALAAPSAFTVTGSPVTGSGTLTIAGAGTTAQYIRGDGSLATFPTTASNLALGTRTATTMPVTNSNGTGITLPVATTSLAGLIAAADKTKLDGLSNYTLPAATASVLGGVKAGAGINVSGDGTISTVNNGTVTSVALSAPSAFTVTGSPVTGSGTLTIAGAGTTAQYVRGDGSLATFPTLTTYTGSTSIALSGSSFQRAALTGDVTAAANSNATTIANNAVTFAKMQDIASGSLIGRASSGTGDPETVTVGDGLYFDGSTLKASVLTAAITHDFPMISGIGASAFVDVSVPGAAVSDVVELGLPTAAGMSTLQFKAYVQSPNLVRITAISYLNTAVDLSSELYRIKVFK